MLTLYYINSELVNEVQSLNTNRKNMTSSDSRAKYTKNRKQVYTYLDRVQKFWEAVAPFVSAPLVMPTVVPTAKLGRNWPSK